MTTLKKSRCTWVNLANPLYVSYHDKEWGKPQHDDIRHFELLTLEGAQAGLSWELVLKKRAHYRRCFAQFAPNKVAKFTPKKIEKLLLDPGIVRHRLKVTSTVTNAKAFLKVQQEFGTFDHYIWSFVQHRPIINHYVNITDAPTKTALSDQISKDLKKRGFRFVGSTIIYSYLQAVGILDDHISSCFVRQKKMQPWFVYIVRAGDSSLYTGITTNVAKRFATHQRQGPQAAKYLRAKAAPLTLVFQQQIGTKSQALKAEYAIKQLSKAKKEGLIQKGLFVI